MKYAITRKINLGRYGLEYEAIDISVSDADSWEEAEKAVKEERLKIHKSMVVESLKRLKKLSEKMQLTTKEDKEMQQLREVSQLSPF